MAVTITAAALAVALRVDDGSDEMAQITRLLAVATATVEQRAPKAPDAVQDEAVVRMAGYLYDQPNAGRNMAYAAALRNSGGLALLLPWRVHGAGVIGASADDDGSS